jgi:hypothetical protein
MMEQWVRRSNGAAALLLVICACVCSLLSRSVPAIYLKFFVNETSVFSSGLGPKFGLNSLFAITLSLAAAIHLYYAVYPRRLAVAIAAGGPRSLRILYLYTVLPSLHACVLVGVARIVNAWAIIAAVLLMIQVVTHIWIVDTAATKTLAPALAALMNLLLYISFWVLVWIASTEEVTMTLALFCATTFVTIGLHVYVGFCTFSLPWAHGVVREFVFMATFVGLQLLCIGGWTVSHPSLSTSISNQVAGAISGLYVVFVGFVVHTAPRKRDAPPFDILADDDDQAHAAAAAGDSQSAAV